MLTHHTPQVFQNWNLEAETFGSPLMHDLAICRLRLSLKFLKRERPAVVSYGFCISRHAVQTRHATIHAMAPLNIDEHQVFAEVQLSSLNVRTGHGSTSIRKNVQVQGETMTPKCMQQNHTRTHQCCLSNTSREGRKCPQKGVKRSIAFC